MKTVSRSIKEKKNGMADCCATGLPASTGQTDLREFFVVPTLYLRHEIQHGGLGN